MIEDIITMENRIKYLDNNILLAKAAETGYAIIDAIAIARDTGVGVRTVRRWLNGEMVHPAIHATLSKALDL